MKVQPIKAEMKNYNNAIKKIAASAQKQEVMQSVQNTKKAQLPEMPDADILQEMLNVFAKERQNEIFRQNEKFIEDLKNPASKLNFNI